MKPLDFQFMLIYVYSPFRIVLSAIFFAFLSMLRRNLFSRARMAFRGV